MAGILNFDQYIGGADQIKIEQVFPSNQKTLIYNFGQSVADWTFTIDQQTLVVDTMTFNRSTGQPNFATSKVIGYFPYGTIDPSNINVTDPTAGIVQVTFPAGLYSGPILPDARQNVPITIIAITWTDGQTPPQINTHRWALVQCWEPEVAPGDPITDPDYTSLGV